MPVSVGIALAAAGVGAWVAGGAAVFTPLWFAGALASMATGVILSRAVYGKPDKPQLPSFGFDAATRLQTLRQPISYWQWIYGEVRVPGAITFMEVSADNRFMHLVVTLAGHEVEAIPSIYFDDELVPLDGSGKANGGRYVKSSSAFRAVQHTIPHGTFQVTVAGTVGSTQSVMAVSPQIWFYLEDGRPLYLVDDSGNYLYRDQELVQVGGTPQAPHEYQRSGSTFTFHSSLAGQRATIHYTETVTDSWVQVKKSLGNEDASTQPFPDLVSASAGKWTSAHKQTGRAKLWVRLEFNPDIFPTGIPNITAVVKGRKVRDPRGPTVAYSPLADLCIADYLQNAQIGLGCTDAEIDEAALIAAANVDDENVALAGGGTENRYELHGAFTCDKTPREIIERLLTATGGHARFIGGKWRLEPAVYRTPDPEALTADDLRGPLHVIPRLSRRELCNGVKGVHVSPDNFWQPSDYPAVTNGTYLAEDQGERIWKELDFPYTRSAAACQRLAKIELEKNRQQITVEWPGMLGCYRLQPGDTVPVTLSRYGWNAKVFEVTNATLVHEETEDGVVLGCDHVLRETSPAVYDWSAEETEVDPAPDTNLPNPFVAGAPSGVAYTESYHEVNGEGRLAWTAPDDAFVRDYQVEVLSLVGAAWTKLARSESTFVDLSFRMPGKYRVRVRAFNQLGVGSAYAPAEAGLEVNVTTPAIGNVTGLELAGQGNGRQFAGKHARFEWRPSSVTHAVEIGAELPGAGAGGGLVEWYFRDYEVRVYDPDGVLLRTEHTEEEAWAYTYEKNVEDGGPRRQFAVKVWKRGRHGQMSPVPATLAVENVLPTVAGFGITRLVQGARIDYQRPSGDADFLGVNVYVSTEQGFTPSAANRVLPNASPGASFGGIAAGITYYVRMRPVDEFGEGDTSVEYSFTPLPGIPYGLDPAEGAFRLEKLERAASTLQVGALFPFKEKLYLAGAGGRISALDTVRQEVVASRTGGNTGLAFTNLVPAPNGAKLDLLYAHQNAGLLHRVDASTLEIGAGSAYGLSSPTFAGMVYAQSNQSIYAGHGNSVSRINAQTDALVTTIAMGGAFVGGSRNRGMLYCPSNKCVYVAGGTNTIKVIDTASDTVTATIATTGEISFGMAFVPWKNRIYVVQGPLVGDQYIVSIINPATNLEVGTITLPLVASTSWDAIVYASTIALLFAGGTGTGGVGVGIGVIDPQSDSFRYAFDVGTVRTNGLQYEPTRRKLYALAATQDADVRVIGA